MKPYFDSILAWNKNSIHAGDKDRKIRQHAGKYSGFKQSLVATGVGTWSYKFTKNVRPGQENNSPDWLPYISSCVSKENVAVYYISIYLYCKGKLDQNYSKKVNKAWILHSTTSVSLGCTHMHSTAYQDAFLLHFYPYNYHNHSSTEHSFKK